MTASHSYITDGSISSYEDIEETLTVSSYESIVQEEDTIYEDVVIELPSEYETDEEEIVVSDYITDDSDDDDKIDTRRPGTQTTPTKATTDPKRRQPIARTNDKPTTKNQVRVSPTNKSKAPNQKSPLTATQKPSPAPTRTEKQDPSSDKQEEDENEANENQEEEKVDDAKDSKQNDIGHDKSNHKVWSLPDTPDSPTSNQKPVARLSWMANDYYHSSAKEDCFNLWKKYKKEPSNPERTKLTAEKKKKRIERIEIIRTRRKIKDRQLETVRQKIPKGPPKRIRVRRTREIVRVQRVKKPKVPVIKTVQSKADDVIMPALNVKSSVAAFSTAAAPSTDRTPTEQMGTRPTPDKNEKNDSVTVTSRKYPAKSDNKEPERSPAAVEDTTARASSVVSQNRLHPDSFKESLSLSKVDASKASIPANRVSSIRATRRASLVNLADPSRNKKGSRRASMGNYLDSNSHPSSPNNMGKGISQLHSINKSADIKANHTAPNPIKTKDEFSKLIQDEEKKEADKSIRSVTSEVYVALKVRDCEEEPSAADYEKLVAKTQAYYRKLLRRKYKEAFASVDVKIRKAAFDSGLPSAEYNIYIEWDIAAKFHDAEEGTSTEKQAPSDHDLCRALVDEMDREFFDYICGAKKTPFTKTSGIFSEQVVHIRTS